MRQLYLVVFQPTAFRCEVEGQGPSEPKLKYAQRLTYFLGLLPWILILACLGNVISGFVYLSFGKPYSWIPSYLGVLLGMTAGAVFGASLRAAATLAGGLAGGLVLGVVGGVAVGVLTNVWIYLTIGVFAGPVFSTLIGLYFRRRHQSHREAPISLLSAIGGLALAIGIFTPIANGQVPIDIYNGLAVSLGAAFGGGLVSGIASQAVFGLDGGSRRFGLNLGASFGLVGAIAFGVTGTSIFGVRLGAAVAIAFLIGFPLALWSTYFRLINYPATALLSLAAYFTARQFPHVAFRAWRLCPVTWDEVIWLPLPYLSKFLLLLIRHDREYGLEQMAFVARERFLQRAAVVNSGSEVVLDDLHASNFSELATTSERLAWTIRESVSLNAGLLSVLTYFDRLAQHGRQYLSITNEYRKNGILENALLEIQTLKKSLFINPSPFASRLLRLTEQWSEIIRQEQIDLAARSKLSGSLPNPFITGEPVREDFKYAFTGRQEIVSKIEESMLGRKHTPTLLLYGPRRMGKTSILKQLPRLLGPEFVPVFIDCQNPAISSVTSSVASWLRYLSAKMAEGLRSRRVIVELLGESSLDRQPFAVFDQWLDTVETALLPQMRILLCLDEYERLQRILKTDWGDEFLDELRHLIQHRPSIALMFCGAHTFAESGAAWTSRFINAKLLRVSFLSYDDILPLLTKPIPEFDLHYEPGVVKRLYKVTRGQPYLTQLVAYELVEYLNEQHRKEASLEDLRLAISLALESGSEYFFNLWFEAGKEGQAILRATAMRKDPPDFSSAKQWLRKQEVLKEDGSFAVPMVERWVKEQIDH